MLDCVRQTLRDVCWLCDSQHQIALRPAEWSTQPSTHGLSFYAPRFNLEESPTPWLTGEEISVPEWTATKPQAPVTHVAADRDRFVSDHGEILKAIAAGRVSKVVPWVREEWTFPEPMRYSDIPKAFTPVPDHAVCGFQFGDEGLCGVTPELLFHLQNQNLTTMALAGTAAKDGPSLLDNKKERLEHDLVIEHIVSVLADLGAVDVGVTREKVYPRLKHLHTPITVQLNREPNFTDLVERLHPTAALGGYPRSEALEFLRARGGDRGRFGAPFGYQRENEMQCVVAIRAVQWRETKAWLMAGCGVVAGSEAEREWQELQLKRDATLKGLGLTWT